MDSDKGFEEGKPQPPSNVTRLARSFKRQCSDYSVQIINYQSGVGTGSTWADAFTGGAFGNGVAEVCVASECLDFNFLTLPARLSLTGS